MGRVFAFSEDYDDEEPNLEGVAVIGGDGLDGVWQPTGDRFEVMFLLTDPVGQFYLRERREPNPPRGRYGGGPG